MSGSAKAIVVAGASLAGLHAAQELRAQGFDGDVLMVGDEDEMPYDRPPLSKQLLCGQMASADLALDLRGLRAGATWRLGRIAVNLDLARREIKLDDGETIRFDGLVIATGASPRRLPAFELGGVHVLRTHADALALKADLDRKPGRVVVVGGGFIGAELASTCRKLGLAVTIVEPARGLIVRNVGERVSKAIGALHRDHGVDLRFGIEAVDAVGDGRGQVRAVRLSDGSSLLADAVIVAIGVTPNTAWLDGSGLTIDDGVVCDETCLAAPGIVAAGDLARWPNRRFGECRRVEHWDNAIHQGRHAARRLLASADAIPAPYAPVPWVWSDQFDLKLQLYGSTVGHEEVRFVDGSDDSGRFIAVYRKGDRLTAAFGIGRTRALLAYRRLLEDGASWEAALAMARGD